MKNPSRFRTQHAVAFATLALSHVALGQITNTYDWVLDSNSFPELSKSWDIDENWALGFDPGVAPSLLSDAARILNGGTAIIEANENIAVGMIVVGGGSNLSVNQNVAVSARQIRVGVSQVGTITLNTGTLQLISQESAAVIEPELVLGLESGGMATLTQTGGSLSADATRLNLSHTETRIGAFGASGTYNLQGGTASLHNLRVGFANPASVGTINHSGGTLTHFGEFALGWADATGIYNLSGTANLVQANNRIRVGATAGTHGVLNQSGGTATITGGRLELGTESGAHGTYNMSGGTMTVNEDIFVGAFDQPIPLGTTGVYNQTGGDVTANRVWLGWAPGTFGTVYLGGGTLRTSQIFMLPNTGTGTVTFDGGTFIATGGGNTIHGIPLVTVNAGGATFNSNGQTTNIVPPVVGVGGVTKTGPGTVSLAALSNYDGNTTVVQGTLALNHPDALDPASAVIIPSTGAELALNYTGMNTVSQLFVDGTPVAPGLYGSALAPGAEHVVTYLTGTGLLKVESVTGPGYNAWASDPANGLAAGERGMGFDKDRDGFDNLLEYFLGGNPSVASTAIAPVMTAVAGGGIQMTFNRSVPSGSDTTAVIQWSTDLQSWPLANQIPVAGTGAISQTVPGSNAVNGKLFTRVKVTSSP